MTVLKRTFTTLPPLSLYIHLPWCVKKCPYCDFNSHQQKAELPEAEYVQALLDDLTAEMPRIWGRNLASVFIGGGTPSLFSPASLDRLMSGIRALTALSPEVEVTLEANPGTVEQQKFHAFRELGINRLSIGIQSFNNNSLRALGRIHDADEALRAVDIARAAGFDNINLDLMFGLPEQSISAAEQDLSQAIALAPEHISYYELTLEPNTLFASKPPVLPHDDNKWTMQTRAIAQLADSGYARYEISAYARDRRRATHNLNYWHFGDYVGIGAGAHGKISRADTGNIERRWKQKHPDTYLAGNRVGGESIVPLEDTALEFMMNALRLSDGFPLPLFQQYTGVDLAYWQPAIDDASEAGLLELDGLNLKASDKGFDYLNDLLAYFLPQQGKTRRYPLIPLRAE